MFEKRFVWWGLQGFSCWIWSCIAMGPLSFINSWKFGLWKFVFQSVRTFPQFYLKCSVSSRAHGREEAPTSSTWQFDQTHAWSCTACQRSAALVASNQVRSWVAGTQALQSTAVSSLPSISSQRQWGRHCHRIRTCQRRSHRTFKGRYSYFGSCFLNGFQRSKLRYAYLEMLHLFGLVELRLGFWPYGSYGQIEFGISCLHLWCSQDLLRDCT